MLKVYTGDSITALSICKKSTVVFPENGRSPWEQIEWITNMTEAARESDIIIKTFSPYILNALNLILAKGMLKDTQVEAYNVFIDHNTNEVFKEDLKVKDENGNALINASCLSDPISEIYEEYYRYRPNPQKDQEV